MRIVSVFLVVVVLGFGVAEGAWEKSFDMGTAESPLKEGWTRVTEKTVYDEAKGFGWTEACEGSFHREKISTRIIEGTPDAMVVDGVTNAEERAFRIDLPDGKYILEVFLGDVGGEQLWANKVEGYPGGPVYSMEMTLDGEVAATDLNGYTVADRRSPKSYLGGVDRAVIDAEAKDGRLLIGFTGNDKWHEERLKENEKAPLNWREEDTVARGVKIKKQPKMWLGEPYDHFSVLGVRVAPGSVEELWPFEVDGWKLVPKARISDPTLAQVVQAYNEGKLDEAMYVLENFAAAEPGDVLAKSYVCLAVSGHPRSDDEGEEIAKAIECLQKGLEAEPGNVGAELLLEEARAFAEGIRSFNRLGYRGENASTNQFRGEAFFRKISKGSPLYLKAEVYRGRIFGAQDPARWAWMWPEARSIIKAIEPEFRDNRYVKFYLSKDAMGGIPKEVSDEDDVRAPGTGEWREDWAIPSYKEGTENAPMWAPPLREAYCRMIDVSEWWIKNRQIENGEIGGGFGDDVEIVQLWGYAGFICKDAAPYALAGAKRMIDGMWSSEEMDRDNGYWNGPVTWVKIPAEWTGYSQPLMMATEYGDPEYYERLLRTTKTMRDFAMYVNENGRRHFRTGYFNSSRHATDPLQRIDPALAWRCMLGASWLSWYSRNRGAEKLMSEWAENWLEVAMGTAKGKPKGIVPSVISPETDEPGAPNSPHWYDAPKPNDRGDYTYPSYSRYIYSLFAEMYLRTGREEYLEPLMESLKIADEGREIAWKKSPPGSDDWVKGLTSEKLGPAVARAAMQLHTMAGLRQLDPLVAEYLTPWTEFLLSGDAGKIAGGLENVSKKIRDGWPMMTADCAVTDKIVPPGLQPAIASYLGGFGATYDGFPGFTVSYERMSKNFAALVRETTPKELKILFFNFEAEDREIDIVPWALEVGGTYSVETGPDADGDQEMDEVASSRRVKLEHRADAVTVELPSRKSWIASIRQVAPGPERKPLPDLAMSERDVWYRARGESAIHVTVHNIGDASADEVSVAVYEGDSPDEAKLIGRAMISHLATPDNLDPQMVRVSVFYKPTKEWANICVAIDPDDEFAEITERNNVLVKRIDFKEGS